MAQTAASCLIVCSVASPALAAPHAPPPPILLEPTPAPELPAAEYARRPFELTPELLLGFASCADGTENDARCSGLSAGPGFGVTALWRASPYLALGCAVAGLGFGFHPAPVTGLSQASARGVFYGLLGRVYFFDHGPIEPYLELGVGGGAQSTGAREADGIRYEESSLGSALRVGGALEFFMGRHVRIGPAFDWTRFELSHLRRCGGSLCTGLDEAANGHGTGFTTLSIRLGILLGPSL